MPRFLSFLKLSINLLNMYLQFIYIPCYGTKAEVRFSQSEDLSEGQCLQRSAAVNSTFLWLEHYVIYRGREDAEHHAAKNRPEYVSVPESVPVGVHIPRECERHILHDHEHIVRQRTPVGIFEFDSILDQAEYINQAEPEVDDKRDDVVILRVIEQVGQHNNVVHAYHYHHGQRIKLIGHSDGENARQNEEEPPKEGQELSHRIVLLETLLGILSFRNFQAPLAVSQSLIRLDSRRCLCRLFLGINGIWTWWRRYIRHWERCDRRYAAKRCWWRCHVCVFRW